MTFCWLTGHKWTVIEAWDASYSDANIECVAQKMHCSKCGRIECTLTFADRVRTVNTVYFDMQARIHKRRDEVTK